ncbi:conserved protein of unknown function [Methanocaldococcus lauensis]|uniref:Uncharacterized protein n=1 Tax=Methanocaldococcus lauensis TaxID=2546128 RepID=A0A8D6SVW5_9EURY|nr:hypothetical protein [Methanocaldococcus lauensis]CAB3288214.1 conserved protein of unknown function [Methanocaldococcus lauensis]
MIFPRRIISNTREFIIKNPRTATAVAGIGGFGIGWIGANTKRDIEDTLQPNKKKSLSSLILVLILILGIIYFLKKQ